MSTGAPFVVAIDGPAGAGKSTAARLLARRLGYPFLDTGAVYRSVALVARQRGVAWSDPAALGVLAAALDLAFVPAGAGEGGATRVLVGGVDVSGAIRTPDIAQGASQVSVHPEVRAALLGLQRGLARAGGLVAEGRDMGTVVFPDARAKFFLVAAPGERARRRALDLAAAGQPGDVAAVLREIEARDARDSTRAVAPLRRADDALEINTDAMTPDEVVDAMAAVVRARGG